MKLDEIKMIPANTGDVFKLPANIENIGKVMGESEHREVFMASFTNSGKEFYVIFNKDTLGRICSYVVISEVSMFGRDVAVLERTWTNKNLQRKGYLSGLIKFIRDNLHMSIMSDKEQTNSACDFWASIEKKFEVKVADLVGNTILDKSAVPNDKIYSIQKPTQYRLFLESEFLKKNLVENLEKPFLRPYKYFEDGDV